MKLNGKIILYKHSLWYSLWTMTSISSIPENFFVNFYLCRAFWNFKNFAFFERVDQNLKSVIYYFHSFPSFRRLAYLNRPRDFSNFFQARDEFYWNISVCRSCYLLDEVGLLNSMNSIIFRNSAKFKSGDLKVGGNGNALAVCFYLG